MARGEVKPGPILQYLLWSSRCDRGIIHGHGESRNGRRIHGGYLGQMTNLGLFVSSLSCLGDSRETCPAGSSVYGAGGKNPTHTEPLAHRRSDICGHRGAL